MKLFFLILLCLAGCDRVRKVETDVETVQKDTEAMEKDGSLLIDDVKKVV